MKIQNMFIAAFAVIMATAAPAKAETTVITTTPATTTERTIVTTPTTERTIITTAPAPVVDTTVVKTTTVVSEKPQAIANTDMINMSAFDLNKDGILSMQEVGARLFFVFDRDGNEIIDNIEFDRNSFLTIMPVEKETITYVDVYHGGHIDRTTTYTSEDFMKQSQLIRFAGDTDGLSPREFIDQSFLKTDINDDKAVAMDEWQEAYALLVKDMHLQPGIYNN